MPDEKSSSQKIRIKFASGEEFEAEGPLEFIETQRDYFLALVKKEPLSPARNREDTSVSGPLTPYTRNFSGMYRGNTAIPSEVNPAPHTIPGATDAFSNTRPWEQLLKQEGELLFLRRKLRLSTDEAALLILGGSKALLHQEECRALLLAKAVALSGFKIPRLDRQLTPAIKLGYIMCIGSKRSRAYSLTPAGFAHAFMLAQKKAAELP